MLRAAILLTISNVFMTFAWYGHLRHMNRALWLVIVVSWGIAFFEYCFQVPANRIGYASGMSAAQLKTLQEVITLTVFVMFATWYLREPIRWNTALRVCLHRARSSARLRPLGGEAAFARAGSARRRVERDRRTVTRPGQRGSLRVTRQRPSCTMPPSM
jgi:uncharacterized protein